MKTLGQVAYEAYCNVSGWKSLVSGVPLPQCGDTKESIQAAWQAAAEATVQAFLKADNTKCKPFQGEGAWSTPECGE